VDKDRIHAWIQWLQDNESRIREVFDNGGREDYKRDMILCFQLIGPTSLMDDLKRGK
jgi:hypothetical protein